MKLKVGQQFEVVEVLTDGMYHVNPFNIGGHTLAFNGNKDILVNGASSGDRSLYTEKHGCCTLYMYLGEVKPVGRLTVKEVKS